MSVGSRCLSLIQWFRAHGRWKVVGAGLGVILIVNLVLFPRAPQWFGGKAVFPPLDIRLWYGAAEIRDYLSALGAAGRAAYGATTTWIDMPYALFYGGVYTLLLALLYPGDRRLLSYPCLIFLPLLITLFDLAENIGILAAVHSFPHLPYWLRWMGYFTLMKWLFAVVTFGLALLWLIQRRHRRRAD